ncbi:MAG: hypothetical protein COA79_23190 [Planctomycetota bacterium]|nr:MAG: hypothetical protein COA79_23190 [Planctomycetota bacterium]
MTDIKETNQLINNASQEMAEIPFCGENILSIYDKQNEEAYVALKPLCKVLDLDFSGQRKKVLGNPSFYCGDIPMIGADGKKRSMFCLSTKEIFGWMLSVNPGKMNFNNRDKLMKFQKDSMDAVECFWKSKFRDDLSGLDLLEKACGTEIEELEKDKWVKGAYRVSVYAIRDNITGHIKIGMSKDVKRRFAYLSTAHGDKDALSIVIEKDVGQYCDKHEKALHRMFADHRLNGEWFDGSQEENIIKAIESESYKPLFSGIGK